MTRIDGERSPAVKLLLAILIGLALAIPLFSVWLLVYDRQTQSQQATESITEGWGGQQSIAGPTLVIPYRIISSETAMENGRSVTRNRPVTRRLTLAPETVDISTRIAPERRNRSIYEAVVYAARNDGRARFALPPDLSRHGIEPGSLDFSRAELRFAISDPRGLGASPEVSAGGSPLRLQPGGGSDGGPGFFAWIDAERLSAQPIDVRFRFDLRGNASLRLMPLAGETRWSVRSAWPHPSFTGDFLPAQRSVSDTGFAARYRIGNLALGRPLVLAGDAAPTLPTADRGGRPIPERGAGATHSATIDLMQPVDLYSRVDRSAKYGFLFIGFTFLALLMFDVVGGVRVSSVEYLLMGSALVLFFVLLLAFAEVIGFTPAYVVAAASVAGLNTAYSAAVLGSWRRAGVIGALLVALYAVLYVLLGLEAFSLLIGSLLLFAALAAVMYATRGIDWSAQREQADA